MSRRAMLALSAALSAFVLVVLGAAAALVLPSRSASPVPSAPVARERTSVPIDVVRASEAEYLRPLRDDDDDEGSTRLAQPHSHNEDDDG